MKKIYIPLLIFLLIVISGTLVLEKFVSPKNKIIGFVIMELNKRPSSVFAALTAFLILVVATSAYFYSTNKFGPA